MPNSEIPAVVKRFYGANAVVLLPDGREEVAQTSSRNKSLVCGDRVILELRFGTYYVVDTESRCTEFCRTDGFGRRKVIAANIDQIALVIAAQPEPHFHAIDRYWVAALNCAIPMVLLVNKADLASTERLEKIADLYPPLGLETFSVSAKTGDGVDELKALFSDKLSVLVGQSGAGKSSLVNRLCINAEVAVGELSSLREEGRHTTTTTDFFELESRGRIMDSPGIREFGLGQYDQSSLEEGFVEISELAGECRFRNCVHQNTPGCAVISAMQAGKIDERRVKSYQSLLAQIT